MYQIQSGNNDILKLSDPIYNFKAIKSKKEIDNVKKAHLYDGVALTKYLFWIKNNLSQMFDQWKRFLMTIFIAFFVLDFFTLLVFGFNKLFDKNHSVTLFFVFLCPSLVDLRFKG